MALLSIAITTWADMPELRSVAGLLAAAAYSVWVVGLGWVLWRLETPVIAHVEIRPQPVGSSANA